MTINCHDRVSTFVRIRSAFRNFCRAAKFRSSQSYVDYLIEAWEKVYSQIVTKIRFELSTKPSKQAKAAQGKSGFMPAMARWVIERSHAWMERCKTLVKKFERSLSHATTKINLCFVRLMLKQLAAN
jgi:Transposase DDE domain